MSSSTEEKLAPSMPLISMTWEEVWIPRCGRMKQGRGGGREKQWAAAGAAEAAAMAAGAAAVAMAEEAGRKEAVSVTVTGEGTWCMWFTL